MLRRIAGGDVPNTVFASDNAEGIPTLRLDRQASMIDLPFTRWGRGVRKSRMRGTFHFFTDDYRFSALWSRPQDLVNSGAVAAVEPNFSVHAQTPRAVALWQTYRKRWLGRYWQETGVRILVDLNVAREHRATNLLGVPAGWSSYATRGGAAKLDQLDEEHELATRVAGGSIGLLFVVYGGSPSVARLSRRRGWIHIPEERDEVATRQPLRQLVPEAR